MLLGLLKGVEFRDFKWEFWDAGLKMLRAELERGSRVHSCNPKDAAIWMLDGAANTGG